MAFRLTYQERIARTGFCVSLVSYFGFWLMDFLIPGFVSRFFSVHLFLLLAIAFGIWWFEVVEEYADQPMVERIIALVIGIVLSVIVWKNGEGFESLRFIATLAAFCVPFLVRRLIKYK